MYPVAAPWQLHVLPALSMALCTLGCYCTSAPVNKTFRLVELPPRAPSRHAWSFYQLLLGTRLWTSHTATEAGTNATVLRYYRLSSRSIDSRLGCGQHFDGGTLSDYRVGFGHDIHRLQVGFALVLGGVNIPSELGFNTHSDGDVLSHALVDALAGAIADGDIGTHYPENDPSAEHARSLDFVREFSKYVAAAGYRTANVDAFLVLGTVRLRPHIEKIRANVAEALGISLANVSIKARSNDGLGPEGEGKACSAWATVLVYPTPSD